MIAIQGLNLGVDFKGGRSYVVSFNQPVAATRNESCVNAEFRECRS
ncbi:MAG: hypothetical protein U5K54_10505 [Cytophagales bacterium]|nr:hypothetical protein [Cytophagales bacterium]